MSINHELWRAVASGGLAALLSEMQAITHPDTLKQLNISRDFVRWLRVELASPGSMSFALSEATLGLLWDEVQATANYSPELRDQEPPFVSGTTTSGGDTLVADTPDEGYTAMVYEFDGLEFALVGTLAANSQPGTGNYVLVLHDDGSGAVGLPSSFLALTS